MMKDLKLTRRRKLLGAVVICVVLITGSTMLWQMGQVAEAAILDPHPGMVGWWRFDEEVGGIATDSSGYGNHGTVYGDATWVDGKYGKALSFAGINNYVKILDSTSLDITQSVTIEAWVKPAESGIAKTILSKLEAATPNYFMSQEADDKYYFNILTTNGITSFSSLAHADVNWHHIVCVFNRATGWAYIYVDGVEEASKNVGLYDLVPSNLDLCVGARSGPTNYWKGIIDEVRIYNRALSAAEIQADFQKSPDFSSKLLAKVPKGATQVITTLSWQGIGSINITAESPSKNYTEDIVPVYQKTVYSTSGGTSSMLNIKRLSVSVNALSSDENWYVVLKSDDVDAYQITVEVQK